MIRLIAFLFTGCWHKWVLKETITIREKGLDHPYGYTYVLQCEHCGNIKGKTV